LESAAEPRIDAGGVLNGDRHVNEAPRSRSHHGGVPVAMNATRRRVPR
jgi:hypothetical protein